MQTTKQYYLISYKIYKKTENIYMAEKYVKYILRYYHRFCCVWGDIDFSFLFFCVFQGVFSEYITLMIEKIPMKLVLETISRLIKDSFLYINSVVILKEAMPLRCIESCLSSQVPQASQRGSNDCPMAFHVTKAISQLS